MADEDDLLADDLNLDYEVDELLEEDLLGDDDEFALSGEENFPDQSDTCNRKPISTEEEDILDIGGIDTNLEIEGDEEDKTGIGVTECDSVAQENEEITESGDGTVNRLRDRFKNERPNHSGHKPIIFDCNENKNNLSQQRQVNINQNQRYMNRGNMAHRGGFQGRIRNGAFNNRQQFTNNQKTRGNFNYIPNRAHVQSNINPWESQGPDMSFNQANQESKKVLINPHFRGNVQPHSDARLIWDPNVGQQNPPPLMMDQYNNGPPQFNRQTQFNPAPQMTVNQFPPIWNEQNPNVNNPILDNQANLPVPMISFSNNAVQQMDAPMNQPIMEDHHNMQMFANNQHNVPNQPMQQCGYNAQNDLYNSESTENFDDNVTYNIQPQQCFKIPTQSGFRGRGHHRGGVRFTQANNIIVRTMSTSNVVPNNFDGSNNFSGRGNFNNGRPLGFEASNRIIAPDQMYQQNQLQVAPQSIIPTYGNSQYQNMQPFQQNLPNNNFSNQCGEFQPHFEQNFNTQTQQNFVPNYNNQMPNQNYNVINMVSNNDSQPPVYQQNSNEHMRKVLSWNQLSNTNQHNRKMHYVQQNRNFNQQNNFTQNKNFIQNKSFLQNKNFNQQRSPRQIGMKRIQQKQYTEVGSSNEPVQKKKKSQEFRNLHEVQTVDVPDTTVICDNVQEEDEDEETKAYRLKIEEQKRKREEYMRMKEERRKKAAAMGGNMENHKYSMIDSTKVEFKTDRSANIKVTSTAPKKHLSNTKGIQKTTIANIAVNRQNVKVIQTVPIRNQHNVINKTNFVNTSNFSRPNNAKIRTVLKPNQVTHIVPKEITTVLPSMSMTVSSSENKSSMPQRVVRQVNPEVDSTESEVINKEHLTSFLSRRVVVPKSLPADSNGVLSVGTGQNVLIKTPVVKISNLAASTTETKLRTMCKGVGLVQSVQMLPDTQQAMIKFRNVASAHSFFKKFQRKIVDLSLIDVKLVNVP